jgi:hypothetical protein
VQKEKAERQQRIDTDLRAITRPRPLSWLSTPANASEQSGQRSAKRMPIIAEIARPRNGWRGHAGSSFTFRGV